MLKPLMFGCAMLDLTAFAGKPSFSLLGRVHAACAVEQDVGTAKLIRWHWTPEAKDAGGSRPKAARRWRRGCWRTGIRFEVAFPHGCGGLKHERNQTKGMPWGN